MEPNGAMIPEAASPEEQSELISPIGYSNSSRCGYCGTSGQSFSYYANATSLSPQFYQTLLDRCWRRSGKLLYRPNQRRSCCPHYTIRLDSHQFRPARDQRQAVNRFNRFVTGDSYVKQATRLYPRSREETKKRDNEFCLSERIHEAEFHNLMTPPDPAHKLEVTLEPDDFTEEKYQVYDNYQRIVHGDAPEERARRSFERFLCSSPIKRQAITGPDGQKRLLGSYHQCYRLDGELVAMGVLDLLPDCVSSVYFLYHERIHKFAPGKLGALREIALATEGGYRWWYPGFYIHSCPKMRYKIDYMPQYILDPDELKWHLLDQRILNILDQQSYVSLSNPLLEGGGDESMENLDNASPLTYEKRPLGENEGDETGNGNPPYDSSDDEDYGSLFRSRLPGIPSIAEMESVDLDHISLKIFHSGPLFETSDLVGWKTSKIRELSGIKHTIAELIAALGPDLIDLVCLDLVRQRG